MRQISVDEAEVGDIVAAPLTNEQGRVLLPKGAKLSAAVLSRLKGWGVYEVVVEGEDPEEEEGMSAAGRMGELEHRFSNWEGDELMMMIKEIARRHLAG